MAVQERNDLGLQLIERNEEVCVFYEKLNLQESIIKKANLKLATRDEELRFLQNEVCIHKYCIQTFESTFLFGCMYRRPKCCGCILLKAN